MFGTLIAAAAAAVVVESNPASVWRILTSFFFCLLEFRGRKSAYNFHRFLWEPSWKQVLLPVWLRPAGESRVDVIKRIGFKGQLQISGKKRGNVVMACCPHSVIKVSAAQPCCWCSCFCDQADSHLLELIHYSWDLHTCHNLLVFPPAMRVCCEAPHSSLWSVPHSVAEVRFSSYAHKCTFYLTFILFCILFALFCSPLFCQNLSCAP